MTNHRIRFTLAFGLSLTIGGAMRSPAARAQTPTPTVRRLSLDDALKLAVTQSQAVLIARAGLERASGQQYQARSGYLPQVSGTGNYTRTLRSQFQGVSLTPTVDTLHPAPQAVCSPQIPANATPQQRQAALAAATTCQSASGINFSKVGFGAPNAWTFGLNVSQNLYSGGRVSGQYDAANATARSASVEVLAQRAQASLDVTQAYYDAILADQLVAIAESTLVQTNAVLKETQLARQVGNTSEYDLLRAQVTHDNQLPVVIQQRSSRQVAYLRLKQLLNLPLDDTVQLTTSLDESGTSVLPAQVAQRGGGAADTIVSDRAPVREQQENVRAQEGLLRVARAERIPSFSLTSGYQRLFFPVTALPEFTNYLQNWTVGVSASVPLFTGGRLKGDEMIAAGNVQEAQARLQQTRQLAGVDTRVALNALAQAEASWKATQGTTDQASRAYAIDQIRYKEGISTQTDLTQSRLLLEQAEANRAQAARDLAVARVRVALLRDLPLQNAGGNGAQTAPATPATTLTQPLPQATQPSTGNPSIQGSIVAGSGSGSGSIQP